MAHVLEHTHSPRMYLQEAFRILKPGGTLAVAVPNIDSQSAKAFGASWQLLMPPLHLFHFSVETLSKFLIDAGFDIERFVGKLYPRIVKSSVSVDRLRSPLWSTLAAWRMTGYVAVQQLRFGVVGADAITAYCSKPG